MKLEARDPDTLMTKQDKEIEEVFRRAVRAALWQHKRLGQSIAAWRDGQIVIIPAEEIPVEDELHSNFADKRERDWREIEIINRNAAALNEEAWDALSYQKIRDVEEDEV